MKIAVFGKTFNDDASVHLKELFIDLKNRNASVFMYEPFELLLARKKIDTYKSGIFSSYSDIPQVDYLLSLGGDGTFLESIVHIRDKNIPILGINTGRLGFLATTPKQKIREDIALLWDNKFQIEERTLLKAETQPDVFGDLNFGLNEFSILKRDTSSMIVVHTFIDDVFLNSYWSDGVLISTPTGSTAYALSCGGPVVMPTSNNFVISAVNPHNLNVRPLVVSDNSKITFQVEGRSKSFLACLDSRSKTVSQESKITIRKEDFKIKIIKIENYHFLKTLREKLNWGLDQRN
ncbi:MAG: NAD kinase [Bacteroidota bacterium]|nr:NAD kinase [Bacteroidota bacterium]